MSGCKQKDFPLGSARRGQPDRAGCYLPVAREGNERMVLQITRGSLFNLKFIVEVVPL